MNYIIFEAENNSPANLLKQMFIALNGRPQKAGNNKNLGMETFSWSTSKDQIGLTTMGEGT